MWGEVTLKECSICGDKANGFNFNVLSCDSCKAFFRRNAFKRTVFKCLFKGSCQIDKKSRKLCRLCRLNKCFATGMKKEWILSEEQRKVRKSIRVTNDNHWILNNQNTYDHNIGEQHINEDGDAVASTPYAAFQSNYSSFEELSESTSNDEDSNDDKQVLSDSWQVAIHRPVTDYRNNLTEVEGKYLTELLNATKTLKIPFGNITSEATTLMDAILVMTSAKSLDSLRYASMSKSLTAFNTVCQSDKFALLIPGFIEMFFMRNVQGYLNDNDKEYFVVPTDREKTSTCLIDLDVYRRSKPYIYSAKIDFYRRIGREWDSDEVILDLMTAIILFNPSRRAVIDPQTVRLQQHIYKYLLQRYLLLKYRTESAAKTKYSRLMNTIEYLHILFVKGKQMIAEEHYIGTTKCNTLFDGLDL